MLQRFRVPLMALATVAAASFGVSTAQAAPAQEATPAADFGSSGPPAPQVSPNSAFLWQSPPTRYIVVLGAKVDQFGRPPAILNQRLDVAAQLAKSHPLNRVILSGGDTWWLPVSEAQFMDLGLLQRGVPPWQLVNEDRSMSTLENANNTVGMLKGMGATGAVVVTNGFHMPRAISDFQAAAKAQHAKLEFRQAIAG